MLIEDAEPHGVFSIVRAGKARQCGFALRARQFLIVLCSKKPSPTHAGCAVNDTLQEPTPEPLFNPMSPEVIADPYPYYHRLGEADPVHHSPLGFFVASRHADVAHVLRDKRFGKDFVGRMTRRFGDKIMEEPVYRSMSHWMLQQDPPDHTRLRGLVVKAFTARRVEDMRPRIQEIVDATLDRVEAQGHMDLIADFAFRLPVTVICEMLGIPKGEHEMFFHGARTGGRLLDPVPLSRAEIDEANAGNLAQAEYFHALFELRRRQPGEDLTSQLVQAEEQGAKLSNEELTANIILLFGAGHETTVNLIGNGLLALHRSPDQLQLLQRDPSLIGNAIEEFLRYDSSVQLTGRTTLEDVEVGGTHVAKGESVLCLLGAANRDPAAYPDPDRLDITRPNIRPLSFGGGIHFCLGAQLARIEGEVAIATLLRRLPQLRIDDPEHADWRQTFVLRGLNRLPASW
jgi:cytochrome P450